MRRGPLYMAAAGLVFTIMAALIKSARAELDALDLVFWRGLTAAPLALLLARRAPDGLRIQSGRLFVLRAGLGFGSMVCSFTAAKSLGVADLNLISKLQPLLIALFAPLVLGSSERAGAFLRFLLLAGLAGCALLLAPGLAVGSLAGILALTSAFLSAGAHLCVRGLVRTEDPRVVVFHLQAALTVLAAGVILVTRGSLPELPGSHLWPHLAGIGLCATLGQLLMTHAYVEDRAAVIAAASYSAPVWGVLVDISVFGLIPGWNAILGGLIIVGAGLVLFVSGGHARPGEPIRSGRPD